MLATWLFKQYIIKDHISHNIASILHAIAKRNSLMRLHKIYSSVTGAIFTAGFGGSVGLESPIILSGTIIGSTIGKLFRLNYKSITLLLGCGAAGAIAAIFNTPIAGIVFALEVLLLDMNRFSPILLKVLATALTTGSGGIGGIFAPSLFTGAVLGYLFAWINNLFNPDLLAVNNFALVGMASVLGGVLQAPLTGIFLIAEIISGYELIVPLMIATTTSYVTSKALSPHNIITSQLAKRGELVTHHKDKAVLHFLNLRKEVEPDFFPISQEATLGGLVQAISLSQRNIFPIINKDGSLVGIILLNDVREIMYNKDYYETSVLNLMHVPPAILNISDSMATVIEKFNQTQAWNLPVCENGRYIGFVSKSKLFSAYREKLMDITED